MELRRPAADRRVPDAVVHARAWARSTYKGSYDQLRGIQMSEAYASTLHISFDVRGGLLMRQMHHWAAMLFIAAMMVHLLRVFFTGAFRKPRELNWVIGCLLLLLGTLEGFTGYSLPDDLLSGTGLRVADGFMKATPVVGTYMSFFLFGGEFPGDSIIPRLYTVHVLLIPGLLLALIGAHMLLLVYHKHTQWPGPGRTEQNVVGYPMLPVYTAKAGGFFFIVFGVTALMGGAAVDQPGVEVRALRPVQGDGRLPARLVHGLARRRCCASCPDWETHICGRHDLAGTSCCPILILPVRDVHASLLMLPFLEAWITGDKREHHLLQRPRNAPTRTAFMVALMTVYGLFWAAGGNDIIAIKLHLSLNQITYFMRVAVFVGPLIAFFITRRWCISLQRHDNDTLLHGYETGIIMRSPEGGYTERHLPISEDRAYTLTARERDEVYDARAAAPTSNGVAARATVAARQAPRPGCRALMYADNVQKPTARGARGGAPPRRARARARGRARPPGRRSPVRRPSPGRGRRAPQPLSAEEPDRWGVLAGLVLLAFNLRPAAVSVGPVLGEVRDGLGHVRPPRPACSPRCRCSRSRSSARSPRGSRALVGLHRVTLLALLAWWSASAAAPPVDVDAGVPRCSRCSRSPGWRRPTCCCPRW